jgi:two-component system copper resistance phosphate regulon response regulator CusR
MRILVVEDDRRINSVVQRGLEEESYAVDAAFDGDDGEYLARSGDYDLVILDIMLPGRDGLQVCRNLRARNIRTPILMLTARDAVEDRVAGLDTGGDDYLIKPFVFDELLARVRALLRRGEGSSLPKIEVGDVVMDTITREVWCRGQPIALTSKEYVVLEYLLRNPNVVVTRAMLEVHAWDEDFSPDSNVVDVYVRRLRAKLDYAGRPSIIQTIRGAGYRMRAT